MKRVGGDENRKKIEKDENKEDETQSNKQGERARGSGKKRQRTDSEGKMNSEGKVAIETASYHARVHYGSRDADPGPQSAPNARHLSLTGC